MAHYPGSFRIKIADLAAAIQVLYGKSLRHPEYRWIRIAKVDVGELVLHMRRG
jgi:hypothetical protein